MGGQSVREASGIHFPGSCFLPVLQHCDGST